MLTVAPIALTQPHYDTLQKYEKYREWARKERKKTIGRVNKLTVASERVDKWTSRQVDCYEWTSWLLQVNESTSKRVNKLTVTSEQVDCYEWTSWLLQVNELTVTSKQVDK